MDEDFEEVVETEEDLKNDEWFKQNYLDLVENHPKEWIAVSNQKIIAAGATRIEVEDKVREIMMQSEKVSIYFVPGTIF